MPRIAVLAISVVGILAAESASAQETLSGRSGWHMFATEMAAPHVVTMAVQDGSRQSRTTITRVGNWIREDRPIPVQQGVPSQQTVIFTDVSSGTSFLVGVGDGGRPQYLQIDGPETGSVHVFTRERTDERDSALGQTCEIWNMASALSNSRTGPVRSQHCITTDGITLWSRIYYGSGSIMRSETAVSLERRQAAADQVRPPDELFDWAYWTRTSGDTASTSGAFDYEATLKSADGNTTRTIRRHFPWTYVETVLARGGQTLGISGGRLSLYYDAGGPDRSPSMNIRILPERPASGERTTIPRAPVPLWRPWEIVAGQVCSWFDVMPGIADAGQHECRTWDGIPLRIREIGYTGHATEFTATRVSRRAISNDDIAPPPSVFDRPR